MSTTNTGGPAFPRPFSVDDADHDISYPAHTGMTLRDYFAAKAMQAMLKHGVSSDAFDEDAEMSYEIADAMLKAREA